jgi:hypothetical protein
MSVEPFKVCARGVQKDGFGSLLLLPVLLFFSQFCICKLGTATVVF